MSLQECEIAWCSPNQLEMMTNTPALTSEQCPVPHHRGQWAGLHLGISRDSLRHPSLVYRNMSFSTGTRVKLHAHNIVLRKELIPRILLKRRPPSHKHIKRNLLSQSVCERDPEFAASRAVDTEIP